jgi:hypothetical protein
MKLISITLASLLSLSYITGCGGGSTEPKPGDLDYVITSGCPAEPHIVGILVTDVGCQSKIQGVDYSLVCKAGQGLNALSGTGKTVQQVLSGTRYTGPVVIGGTHFACMSGKY